MKNYKTCSSNSISQACRRTDSAKFKLIRYNARKVFNDSNLPRICKNCSYSKHVEICHIKPIKDFSPTELISEVNSLDNLIPLCPNCHWEFDHNRLELPITSPSTVRNLGY